MNLFPARHFLSNPFAREYDVTPDGQRFIMIRPNVDARTSVVVVFRFLDELKQRFRN